MIIKANLLSFNDLVVLTKINHIRKEILLLLVLLILVLESLFNKVACLKDSNFVKRDPNT